MNKKQNLSVGETVKTKGEITKIFWVSPDSDNLTHIFQIQLSSGKKIGVIGKVLNCHNGDSVEIEGIVSESKYGLQIKATHIKVLMPETNIGITRYLTMIADGVGEVTAKKIVGLFKDQTIKTILETPEKLKGIKGVSAKHINALTEGVKKDKEFRDITIFLMEYCEFSNDRIITIYEKYDLLTEQMIRENPYRLIRDFSRIGFKKADSIAMKLGLSKTSSQRISEGILYCVDQAVNSGSCAVLESKLEIDSFNLMDLQEDDKERYDEFLAKLIEEKLLYKEAQEREFYIFPKILHEAELSITKDLIRLTEVPPDTVSLSDKVINNIIDDKSQGVIYTDEQKTAILGALKNKITIITGGPGTGKTTIISGIVKTNKLLDLTTGNRMVVLAAPTGKASKRMTEKTGTPAQTIHRLIELYDFNFPPLRNIDNPISADVVIIDESSMIDTVLFSKLINSVKSSSQLILVGDINQLPSIGSGNILKDLIKSGNVEVVKLTKPQRQAENSNIIKNAHLINKGEEPIFDSDAKTGDFFLIETNSDDEIAYNIRTLVESRLVNYFAKQETDNELNNFKDIQVLSPMNKGDIGNDEINKILQDVLNPSLVSIKKGFKLFKEGDKIIQTKNNKEKSLFNGDMGVIQKITQNNLQGEPNSFNTTIEVWFEEEEEPDSPGVKKITKLNHDDLDDIKLAYSISIHKSQGSEYPIVIIPVTKTQSVMLERKLFYTGITRASKMVILIGEREALSKAIRNNKSDDRITGLLTKLNISEISSI